MSSRPKKPAKALRKAPAKTAAPCKCSGLSDAEIATKALPGESWEAARARLNHLQQELEV
jgi:hypothetical protein